MSQTFQQLLDGRYVLRDRGKVSRDTAILRALRPLYTQAVGQLGCPPLSESQRTAMARDSTDALRKVMVFCVDLFRRRPELAKRVGISADELEELRRGELTIEDLIQIVARFAQSLHDGRALLLADLSGLNGQAEAALEQVAVDPAIGPAARTDAARALTQIYVYDAKQKAKEQAKLRREQRRREAANQAAEEAGLSAETGEAINVLLENEEV